MRRGARDVLRSVLWPVFSLFCLYGLYVLIANRRIEAALEQLRSVHGWEVRCASGYSKLPGKIALAGLSVSAATWSVRVDRLALDVDLLSFLQGDVEIGQARASGVELELHPARSQRRERLSERTARDPRPLAMAAAGDSKHTDSNRRIRVDRLTAEIAAVRAEPLRAQGPVEVQLTGLDLSRASGELLGDTTFTAAALRSIVLLRDQTPLARVAGWSVRGRVRAGGALAVHGSSASATTLGPLPQAVLDELTFELATQCGEDGRAIGSLRAASATIAWGTLALHGRLDARARAAGACHAPAAWELQLAELRVLELSPSPLGANPRAAPLMTLELSVGGAAPAGPGAALVSGQVKLRGTETGALFELLGVPASMKLMFSEIEHEPFLVEGRLTLRPPEIELEDAHLESGDVSARGDLSARGASRSLVLLVTARGVSAGVTVRDGRSELVLGASEAWLAERRRALETPP